MVIQRYGSYFVKLSVGDQVVGVNPPAKESKLQDARFGADIALVSLKHADFTGTNFMEHKSKDTVVISGPGEYEVQDIFVHGFPVMTKYDGKTDQINTVYSVLFEGIRIVYLGPISGTELPEDAQEDLYQSDIIFVPIGGDTVMESEEAFKFVKKFSPKIVIPIGYDSKKDKEAVAAFTSSFGESVQTEDKLTIKKKDVETESMNVVVLAEAK